MILILTFKNDLTAELITKKLDYQKVSYFLWGGRMYPNDSTASISVHNDVTVKINTSQGELSSNDITSVWNRRFEFSNPYVQTDPIFYESVKNQSNIFLNNIYPALSHAYWLSSPENIKRANNKVFQQQLAKKVGFSIIETYYGNSINDASEFICKCDTNNFIIKPFGRYFISKPWYEKAFIYTHRTFKHITNQPLPDIELSRYQPTFSPYSNYIEFSTIPIKKDRLLMDLDLLTNSPVMLQPYIDKQYELRVTVVGNQIFAAKIDSQKHKKTRTDWRNHADEYNDIYSAYELPQDVSEKCFQLMKTLGLDYGAFDFIKDINGNYIFLEVNPNGQWGFIEVATGLPIANAMIDLLLAPAKYSLL